MQFSLHADTVLIELVITMSEASLKTQRSRIIEPTSVTECYKIWSIIELQRHLKFALIGNLIPPAAKQKDSRNK